MATHVNVEHLAIGIFDCGVVAFYPHVLHKLGCSRVSRVTGDVEGWGTWATYLLGSFSRLHLMRHGRQSSSSC